MKIEELIASLQKHAVEHPGAEAFVTNEYGDSWSVTGADWGPLQGTPIIVVEFEEDAALARMDNGKRAVHRAELDELQEAIAAFGLPMRENLKDYILSIFQPERGRALLRVLDAACQLVDGAAQLEEASR